MTEHIREMSARSRQALPKNRIEFVAWIIAKGGLGMIFLLLLIAVWWQGEKRNDELRDLVSANVSAFQQVSNDLRAQRETLSEIRSDIRDLRHPSTVQNNPTTTH